MEDLSDTARSLLDAFAAEAAEAGLGAVKLRSVARRAGLSHAAPAHFFGSMEGMRRAFAEVSCNDLGSRVLAARAGASDESWEALVAEGEAVIDWAVAEPARFDVLFRVGAETAGPAIAEVRAEIFGCFRSSIEAVIPAADVERVALEVWATTIGLASMLLDGTIPDAVDQRAAAGAVIRCQVERLKVVLAASEATDASG